LYLSAITMGRDTNQSTYIGPDIISWINSFTDNQLLPRGAIQIGTRAASPTHVERNPLEVSTDGAHNGGQIPCVVFTFFPPITLRSLPRRIALRIPLGWWNVLDSQDIRKALYAEVKGYLGSGARGFPNKLVAEYEQMSLTSRFLQMVDPSTVDFSTVTAQPRTMCSNGQMTITVQAEGPYWRFTVFNPTAKKPRSIVIHSSMMVSQHGETTSQTILRVLQEANSRQM